MMIKKTLLAAAAVIGLAAPAVASAQDFYGHGYGYADGYRHERFEQRRYFAWRRIERERAFRHHLWRSRFEQPGYGWRD